jgi:hypothetical protein
LRSEIHDEHAISWHRPKDRVSPISLNYTIISGPQPITTSLANNYLAVNQDSTDKNHFTSRADFTESSKSTGMAGTAGRRIHSRWREGLKNNGTNILHKYSAG